MLCWDPISKGALGAKPLFEGACKRNRLHRAHIFLSHSLLVQLAIREWITSIPLKQCSDQEKGVGIINGKILESFSPVAWLQLQGKQDTMLHAGRRKRKGAEPLMTCRDWLSGKNKVVVAYRHSWPTLQGEERIYAIVACTGYKYHRGKWLVLDDQEVVTRSDWLK